MEIRLVEAELFHSDEWTDGHDEANSGFSQFCAWKQKQNMWIKYRISCCHILWYIFLTTHFKTLTYTAVKYFTPTFQFVLSLWPLRPCFNAKYT